MEEIFKVSDNHHGDHVFFESRQNEEY
jgi:hypothetical protein